MSVIFSRACEYALKALIEMARRPEKEPWRIQDLAEITGTPAPFLAKTMQLLVKGKILRSAKGRRGGFSFARPPKKISLIEIVQLLDGTALTEDCALGFPTCNNENPCPFHWHWAPIRGALVEALSKETLEEAASSNT